MKKYYATLGTEHGGPGCVEITASNYRNARQSITDILGSKWAFMYESIDDVHINDRAILLKIE
jgi:hypothetical protein